MESRADFTESVNVGNPCEFTMLELAEITLDLVGSKSSIVFMPLPEDDPKQRKPDISLAKQQLQWKPKCPLKEGLIKTIAYFKSII